MNLRHLVFTFSLAFCSGCTSTAIPTIKEMDPPSQPKSTTYEPNTPMRLYYGTDSLQFGDLRIPEGDGPFPIVMIIHGGCWRSQYKLDLMDNMSEDLTNRGMATWNIEYRRTEDPGGGWPGTFHDVVQALAFIADEAEQYPLDMNQLMITGHSAGGHLALWLGCYRQIPPESDLHVIDNLPSISGIVSLAGIVDLTTYYNPQGCGSNAANLIGGLPKDMADRYNEASPMAYTPIGIDQVLITGVEDRIVPIDHVDPYFNKAKEAGDQIEHRTIESADHFDVITPGSVAWQSIVDAFTGLLN